jgi:hypothetical protein
MCVYDGVSNTLYVIYTEIWNMILHIFNRDQWKGYVAPYHPVFLDGWSPEYPVADEREHMPSTVGSGGNTTTAAVTAEGSRTRAEDVSMRFYI